MNATPRIVAGGVSRTARLRTLRAARDLAADRPVVLVDETLRPDVDPAQEVAGLGGLPEGTALVVRTSGSTTGTGSLVAMSRRALLASARATEEALGGPGRWATCLPTDHIAGFQTQWRSILAGCEPVDAGAGRPHDLARAAETGGAGRLYASLVPTQLRRLLTSPAAAAARRFDAILVGGAAASAPLLGAARDAGLRVIATYGMTETCGGCVYDGMPIGDTSVDVGPSGRISIEGSVVALGRVGGPGFQGRVDTQDAGIWRDGRLSVLGRLDDAITTGGVTVAPGIVEEALAELGVEGVVVGVDDHEWGQAVVAVVTAPADGPALREAIAKEHGPAYAPRAVLTVADLGLGSIPLKASGKPDRRALRDVVSRRRGEIPPRPGGGR